MAPIKGLPGLANVLSAHAFTTADLTLTWTPQTLGSDLEGDDWLFDAAAGIETRYYSGGEFTLQLNGEPLIGGSMPQTKLAVRYNDLRDCEDDQISSETAVVVPEDRSSQSSAAVRAVATAFIDDLAGHGLTFVFDSLQHTRESITMRGRTGTFLQAAAGQIDVGAACSCAIGIDDADRTHEWTLFWPEATLPDNGPIRLKVVATTPAAITAPAGRLTATVFDESAPTRGVVLDVAYSARKGEAEGWIELDILPQKEYSFTLQHTGSGRHYRLGSSHAALRLGQSDQRYLPGRSQNWAIEVASGDTVTFELATDAGTGTAPQATTALVTVTDPDTDEIVHGPILLDFESDTVRIVSFQHSGPARRLLVQIDPDGAFRLKRADGEGHLYSHACPSRDGLAIPTLTMTDGGVTPRVQSLDIGQRIFVINRSSATHQLASNPHPFHTNCPPLNQPGPLRPGQSGLSGPFEAPGRCGYHNHLNPFNASFQGEVIVEDP